MRSGRTTGAGAGARYGILVALLGFGANLIQFAVHPLTTRVLGFWGIGGLIELAIAGAIIGAIVASRSGQGMQAALPFGVFLGFGALAIIFFGPTLWSWYLALLPR